MTSWGRPAIAARPALRHRPGRRRRRPSAAGCPSTVRAPPRVRADPDAAESGAARRAGREPTAPARTTVRAASSELAVDLADEVAAQDRVAPQPAAASAVTSATSRIATRRARSDTWPQARRGDGERVAHCSRWQAQHVADSPHGVDERGLDRVDLAPQVGDVRLDDVRLAVEVVVPDVVEDLRLRQHPAGFSIR